MRYSAAKANIRHWRKMYKQANDPERTMVRAVTRACGYADDWKQRTEVAEAKLKAWEEAANSNDPYITNGGYVEVEVLEAVKRRNAELLAHAEEAEAKYQFELQYRLSLSRTVNAELKLLTASTQRAEKWKARAEALEERNDTTPLDAIKTVLQYSEFQGWSNEEAVDAYRKLGDWLQFRR